MVSLVVSYIAASLPIDVPLAVAKGKIPATTNGVVGAVVKVILLTAGLVVEEGGVSRLNTPFAARPTKFTVAPGFRAKLALVSCADDGTAVAPLILPLVT